MYDTPSTPDPYVADLAGYFAGEYGEETALARSELRYAVTRQRTDRASGALLDARRAVLVHITPAAEPDGSQPRGTIEVIDADRWDTCAEAVAARCAERGIALRLLDGRELFPRSAAAAGARA